MLKDNRITIENTNINKHKVREGEIPLIKILKNKYMQKNTNEILKKHKIMYLKQLTDIHNEKILIWDALRCKEEFKEIRKQPKWRIIYP